MATPNYEYYGLMVKYWDLLRGDTSNWSDRFFYLDIIKKSGEPVLDVGCSSGKHTFRAAELGLAATGIDCSEGMLARARALAAESHFDIEFVSGDYTKMPFDHDSFDYALFPKNIVECGYPDNTYRLTALNSRYFP